MAPLVDLTGRCFGRLTVISRAPNDGRRVSWNCQCACGHSYVIKSDGLRSGSLSCGCLQREWACSGKSNYRHGGKGTPEYKVWDGIKQRCLNPKSSNYKDYGGRGIELCRRWMRFENFLVDMGKRPSGSHTIERIDVNGPYSPTNCKWATWIEQNNNQRRNRRLIYEGRLMTAAQWARELEIKYSTFKWYLYTGISLRQIIERKGR